MKAQRELENFFSDVEKISFRAPESAIRDTNGPPSICLFLEDYKLNKYWKSGINDKIVDLLDHKRPVFRFTRITATKAIGLSLVDEETGQSIEMPNAKLDDSMEDFVNFTGMSDKIFLMVAGVVSDPLQSTRNNLLIILDGYQVVYA